ncbi:TPA: hypothetical protein ACH3X3_004263 [Trebouxia sp. C0006]
MSRFNSSIIAFVANTLLLTPIQLSACPQQLELIVVGHVKGMNVPAKFYASPELLKLVSNEFHTATGGFTGAVQQLANVATLPGIVGSSIGMPDIHSGYGFAVGNVAAFDLADPKGVVSPGGVGFDINCGVRLLRSDLTEEDVKPLKSKMADNLFHQVPVGVGGKSELKYQKCGQPVLIGGSMGTSSYVLVGTQGAMQQTFGSTCHGAGRAMSRAQSKKTLGYKEVCPPLIPPSHTSCLCAHGHSNL